MKSLTVLMACFAVVGMAVLANSDARAELIAYEGFGTSGNLNGSTGSTNSTGFSAAWTAFPTLPTEDDAGFVQLPPGMTMPVNYAGGEGGHVDIRSSNSTNYSATRPLSTSIAADSGDTWYFSFEAQRSDVNNYPNMLVGLNSGTDLTNADRIQVGFSAAASVGNRGFIYVKSDGVGVADLLSGLGTAPKFFVAKVVTDTNGSVDVFLKYYADTDVLPAAEPVSWDQQILGKTGFDDVSLNYVSVNGKTFGGTKTYGNRLDEFRLGTTWQDVAPIPEPSTLALLGAGLIGLLAYAWKKHK